MKIQYKLVLLVIVPIILVLALTGCSSSTKEQLDLAFALGYESGLLAGQMEGYEDGLKEGQPKSYDQGYNEGYTGGYNAGFQDGLNKTVELPTGGLGPNPFQ